MRLPNTAPELALRGRPHWLRCSFAPPGETVARAALSGEVVTLEPLPPPVPAGLGDAPFTGGFAGLAFDRHCRVFHPRPEDGGIDYLVWGSQTALSVVKDKPQDFAVTNASAEAAGFAPAPALPERPVSLGCDDADYLYIADAGDAPALWLVDVWTHDVARRIALPAPPRDLAIADGRAFVVFAATDGSGAGGLSVGPCEPPKLLPWPAGTEPADRIAMADAARVFILTGAGTADAAVQALDDAATSRAVPFATDLLVGPADADGIQAFVFARRPGEDFLQYGLQRRHFSPLPALQAPGYDGRGIARAPDGRIAYWTARGLRHAAPARTRYATEATILGFALDSDQDGNRWGRVLLDACVPEGTAITLRCFTRDDLDQPDPAPRVPPAGETLAGIAQPELTPLPSTLAWALRDPVPQPLYRDPLPPPMAPPPPDRFLTYDAPVIAPAGRFLWLAVTLSGNGARTPQLRGIRIEVHEHGLLRQLPRTLWRDPRARDFLGRYLATPAALLAEWGTVAALRQRLLDPRVAPAEGLDWLGSLVGLAMDPCWSEAARRTMLAEASALFRIRGTVAGLTRMLEILTGGRALIIEKYRLRGGGVIGNAVATRSSAVLGAGLRVGGAIGATAVTALPGGGPPEETAHRFTVMLVAQLDAEQLSCARRLVEAHKPAHTLVDLCTVETGARVGVGLHVGLASVIGRSSGFGQLTLGDSVLGRGYALGRPPLDPTPRPGGWSAAP